MPKKIKMNPPLTNNEGRSELPAAKNNISEKTITSELNKSETHQTEESLNREYSIKLFDMLLLQNRILFRFVLVLLILMLAQTTGVNSIITTVTKSLIARITP